jgi:peptide deformylase
VTIIRIAQLGDPMIRRPAEPVEFEAIRTAEVQRLIDDMIETMREADGVGIAAPQVSVLQQIFAMEVRDQARYTEAELFPLTVFINPVLEVVRADWREGWEGCLSVQGLRGYVRRYRAVRIQGLTREARPMEVALEGFPAVVAQHECDHLEGLVYLDRMADLKSLSFEREYRRYHAAPSKTSTATAT